MAETHQDDYSYEWEAKRKISDDLILNCNFPLDVFPAVLESELRGNLLISGPELYKLMEEAADRFEKKIVDK